MSEPEHISLQDSINVNTNIAVNSEEIMEKEESGNEECVQTSKTTSPTVSSPEQMKKSLGLLYYTVTDVECLERSLEHIQEVKMENMVLYKCKLCFQLRRSLYATKVHVVGKHLHLKSFSCSVCNMAFSSNDGIRRHVMQVHEPSLVAKFKCMICKKQLFRRHLFVQHMRKHKCKFLYTCDYCRKGFHSKKGIESHIERFHMKQNLPVTPILCDICGISYSCERYLKYHKRRVHPLLGKRYSCVYCSKTFNRREYLETHTTLHSGERNYNCDVCSKTFRSHKAIYKHMSTHFNPKSHLCATCGHGYADKSKLKEHMLKHEGIRKYSCQECGKTFAQSSHLATHKFVHREKRFACSVCGDKFKRNDNMKSHEKRHSAVKEVAAKKVAVKKVAVKKVAVKKVAVKKVAVKNVAVKNVVVKKEAVKKVAVKQKALKRVA